MRTNQVNLGDQRGKSDKRETPSKTIKLKSKKSLKPEQNQLMLEHFKNPHKGVGQEPTSQIKVGSQEGWTSNREVPTQYADFKESENLES